MISYINQKGETIIIEQMSHTYLHNSLGFFSKELRNAEEIYNGTMSVPDSVTFNISEISGKVSYLRDLVAALQNEYDKRNIKTS